MKLTKSNIKRKSIKYDADFTDEEILLYKAPVSVIIEFQKAVQKLEEDGSEIDIIHSLSKLVVDYSNLENTVEELEEIILPGELRKMVGIISGGDEANNTANFTKANPTT